MKITDEAKVLIKEALSEKEANSIRLHTSRSCCGTSLQFELVTLTDQDQPETINDLSVLMDNETRAWTGTVTISAEGGSLTLHDSAASCCCG